VFGAAIGTRITEIRGGQLRRLHRAGLAMLMLLTQSVTNASFGIYFSRFTGTIYEILSAPVSYLEIVTGYVGAPRQVGHPGLIISPRRAVRAAAHRPSGLDARVPPATAVTFSLFGFIIGIWADGFEQLQFVPLLVITPLTSWAALFYSISRAAARLADSHPVQSVSTW